MVLRYECSWYVIEHEHSSAPFRASALTSNSASPDAALGHETLIEYMRLPWEHGSTAEKSRSALEYAFLCLAWDTGEIVCICGIRVGLGRVQSMCTENYHGTDHEFIESNGRIEHGDDDSCLRRCEYRQTTPHSHLERRVLSGIDISAEILYLTI
jgi:hypothetical protein